MQTNEFLQANGSISSVMVTTAAAAALALLSHRDLNEFDKIEKCTRKKQM